MADWVMARVSATDRRVRFLDPAPVEREPLRGEVFGFAAVDPPDAPVFFDPFGPLPIDLSTAIFALSVPALDPQGADVLYCDVYCDVSPRQI